MKDIIRICANCTWYEDCLKNGSMITNDTISEDYSCEEFEFEILR